MRISGGGARGVRLKVPSGTRPAAERVRQAVFGSLGRRVHGARVLDLFCGSGAYALEALSRGAVDATGVDRNSRAVSAARANARAAGFEDHLTLVRKDASAFAGSDARRRGPFDLVFCDPPYGDEAGLPPLLTRLRTALVPQATVVVERRWTDDPAPSPSGYVLEADRRYGDTQVLIYRARRGEGEG